VAKKYRLSICGEATECGECGNVIPKETEFYLAGDDVRCKDCKDLLSWKPPAMTADENLLDKINSRLKKVDEKVVFLIVHFHSIGNQRKVDSDEVETQVNDKDRISVAKRLLASREYELIKGFDSTFSRWLNEICFPYDPSVRIAPLAMVEQIEAAFRLAATKRQKLVDRFIEAYPTLKAQAKKALGKLYDEADYPPADQVRAAFSMDWNYMSFEAAGGLAMISPELFKAERKKIESRMDETFQEIRDTMRLGLLELVNRLNESLQPGDDGKNKKLTSASVDKLQDFLATSPFRNVTCDAELTKMTDELRKIMQGIDRDKLAENEGLQERVQKTMASVAGKLEVMTKGARRFRVDGDE
jgi:hypothetical protein